MTDKQLYDLCWDNVESLDQTKVENAVVGLTREFGLQMTADDQKEIVEAITRNRYSWSSPHHFGWGMGVRNTLRRLGFTEKYFGIDNLDDYYVPMIEMAFGFQRLRPAESLEAVSTDPALIEDTVRRINYWRAQRTEPEKRLYQCGMMERNALRRLQQLDPAHLLLRGAKLLRDSKT